MTTARSTADILSAAARVAAAFPFPGYITEGDRQGLLHVIRELTRHLPGTTGQRLLDIGSGPMDRTAVFSELGFSCCAVDDLQDPWHRRDGNLERILAFAQSSRIDFHLQAPDDYTIPFEEDSFDVATIFAVIEHLHSSPRDILNAAGRYLKTGGLLCITMPNSVNLRKRLSVLRGRTNYPPVDQFFLNPGTWRGHVREYTLAETVYICKAAGFEVLSATTFEEIAYNRLTGPVLSLYLATCRLVPTFRSALCVVVCKPAGWHPRQPDEAAFRAAVAASVPEGVR